MGTAAEHAGGATVRARGLPILSQCQTVRHFDCNPLEPTDNSRELRLAVEGEPQPAKDDMRNQFSPPAEVHRRSFPVIFDPLAWRAF